MAAVSRSAAGAPLVSRSRTSPPWTLIAMCGRDRAELVVPCLRSVRQAWPELSLLFHRDPLDSELARVDLRGLGCNWVRELELDPELQGPARVAKMRAEAALSACGAGYQRVLFLDSDIIVDPGAAAELERLWEQRPTPDAAVALTRCAVYDSPGYVRPAQPLQAATVRTHGLGMALAFRAGEALQRAALGPIRGSWDSAWCASVAVGCVVTPEQSWAIHEGRNSGLCQRRHPGLDVIHPTPHLERQWRDGQKAAQRRAELTDPAGAA